MVIAMHNEPIKPSSSLPFMQQYMKGEYIEPGTFVKQMKQARMPAASRPCRPPRTDGARH